MLPSMLFKMEDESNSLNNNVGFGSPFAEESVILNGVRSRKKNSELPNCPVCSCTIRNGELESHLNLEIERLSKLSCGSKRKYSQTGGGNLAMPGPSDSPEDRVEIIEGGTGSDVFMRVHSNRISRLRSRTRRTSPVSTNAFGECPLCEARLPMSKLQRHALRCLKRSGASIDDDDIPDSSDEDIDVENDDVSTSNGNNFTEYQWCGESRVRATALQEGGTPGTSVRRASQDTALIVDDDEDAQLYGPPQYSPSRIQPNTEERLHPCVMDASTSSSTEEERQLKNGDIEDRDSKSFSLVEASAETRIQALKSKIVDLEARHNSGLKCLICLSPYVSPAVSIQCWHVYCEVCWLESLRAKKICPQCNAITTTQHLRRIYM